MRVIPEPPKAPSPLAAMLAQHAVTLAVAVGTAVLGFHSGRQASKKGSKNTVRYPLLLLHWRSPSAASGPP